MILRANVVLIRSELIMDDHFTWTNFFFFLNCVSTSECDLADWVIVQEGDKRNYLLGYQYSQNTHCEKLTTWHRAAQKGGWGLA